MNENKNLLLTPRTIFLIIYIFFVLSLLEKSQEIFSQLHAFLVGVNLEILYRVKI